MAMDVLIVGSGGREHALAWKISQSPRVGKVYVAPGGGGTAAMGLNVPIDAMDFAGLARFAQEKGVSLTVVGPEEPLEAGIVDFFKARGLRIFGPTKAAAKIETSKAFSKQIMQEVHIPTASATVSHSYTEAVTNVRRVKPPYVIKASGLARGKGVAICNTLEEALEEIKKIMVDKVYGDAGNELVIEEFVGGPEISVHALTDGKNFVTFPASQDHKKIGEKDTGKNTGGMGVIAPVPWAGREVVISVEQNVLRPALDWLLRNDTPFSGLLYPGIKVPLDGLRVLEFNARFGDPETQAYMRLLKSDLLDLLERCVDGGLTTSGLEWHFGFVAVVVLAASGYPDEYKTRAEIAGLREAERIDGVVVFHMGTTYDGSFQTNGGRVLGVSAIAGTLEDAIQKAYMAADKIQFEGKYFRKDIGASALS